MPKALEEEGGDARAAAAAAAAVVGVGIPAASPSTSAAPPQATTTTTTPLTLVLEAARRASARVSGSDAAARRRWAALPDEALAREVDAYRRDIRALATALLGEEGGGSAVPPVPPGSDHHHPAATTTANDEEHEDEWRVPPHCIPIHADVRTFDWPRLASTAQFDVVLMDPPWQLATANPTRGVALGYSQLADADILRLPVPDLQRRGGFLFVWVINAKYKFTLDLFDAWGYTLVDEIVWVKSTINRRLAKSHGYYLQHAKETCLVGFRPAADDAVAVAAAAAPSSAPTFVDRLVVSASGPIDRSMSIGDAAADREEEEPAHKTKIDRSTDQVGAAAAAAAAAASPPSPFRAGPMPWELAVASRMRNKPSSSSSSMVGSDVIFAERRGQSQKPEEMYELIEQMVPNGRYLELFARKNNLRAWWVSIGNEVTGTGLPPKVVEEQKDRAAQRGHVGRKEAGGVVAGGDALRAMSIE